MNDDHVLITGGAGFIGSNLADRLATMGHQVLVLDALARPGVERNVAWLKTRHPRRIAVEIADICDGRAVTRAVRDAKVIFHYAAQVAVTTSLADPLADFETNIRGTLGLLEALRRSGKRIPLIFASTNKVYGDLADLRLIEEDDAYRPGDEELHRFGISERRRLDFHTPYGCSKGAADQYVLDYARSYDIPTCVLRMSCIYGQRQLGTEDQGWVAHFLIRAIDGEPISIFGDGRQVRDILDVGDAIKAYVAAWQRISSVRGRAFNLGGGPANAVSLRQLIAEIERLLGRRIEVNFGDWRAGDQRYYVSDITAVRRALDLPPPRNWRGGVAALARWLLSQRPAHDTRQTQAEAVL